MDAGSLKGQAKGVRRPEPLWPLRAVGQARAVPGGTDWRRPRGRGDRRRTGPTAQGRTAEALPAGPKAPSNRAGSGRGAGRRLRNVGVMFVDIEGCTRLCEDLSPNEMNRVIETYFSRYLDIVRDSGGEVTEFLGDGLVALFEGPSMRENAARAGLAALRIREATRELNTRERGWHDHPIVVNIGLNAGAASVGITRLRGQSGELSFYVATGPVTNIAARLCALAAGGQILISRTMAESLRGRYRLRGLGPRTLKNVNRPVEVFEMLATERRPQSHQARAGRERTNG